MADLPILQQGSSEIRKIVEISKLCLTQVQANLAKMRIMVEKKYLVGLFALAIACYYKITQSQWIGGPTVSTQYGDLKGIRSVSRGGREYFEFLGIPYATPPIGELRFEVRIAEFSGIRCDSEWTGLCPAIEVNKCQCQFVVNKSD